MQLAVLGDPLHFTLSPDLHRAGLQAVGLDGDSRALRTPADRLVSTLDALALEGLRGVNLTHPLKEAVLPHLIRVSAAAQRARSVNTVGFDADGWWGDTTDGPGFMEFLGAVSGHEAAQRAVFLGAGGAARSLAASLLDEGADITVVARDPARAQKSWAGLEPVGFVAWGSPVWREAESPCVLVNATPLTDAAGALPVEDVPAGTLAVDLVYGREPTAWVRALRARGIRAYDGLGLLVHQARLSLCKWTDRDVPVEPLARAVGWAP